MSASRNLTRMRGFTLIEVLVALAILAIALTALILSSIELTAQQVYLKEKTLAVWVARDALNEARLGLIEVPYAPGSEKGKVRILKTTLFWQASKATTEDPDTDKLSVTVLDKDRVALLTLTGFIGK